MRSLEQYHSVGMVASQVDDQLFGRIDVVYAIHRRGLALTGTVRQSLCQCIEMLVLGGTDRDDRVDAQFGRIRADLSSKPSTRSGRLSWSRDWR